MAHEPPEQDHDDHEDHEDPDAFARMVAAARTVTGYDPGAEDEAEDELAAGRTIRWAGRSILVATLVLAVLNAASIKSWASTLAPSWGAETIGLIADLWAERTAQAGLDQPRQAIHDAYQRLKATPAPDKAKPPPPPAAD